MDNQEIRTLRLANQQISSTDFTKPEELVQYLGAMQAQEYAMAKWAIGLRIPNLTVQDVDAAIDAGKIIRMHLLRPTWHFIVPEDSRWMLALTAPQIHKKIKSFYSKFDLTPKKMHQACSIIEEALVEKELTRKELAAIVAEKGIQTTSQSFSFIILFGELEGLLCSGKMRGNQAVYTLLSKFVAPLPSFIREEALAKLALRYFTSRGPATVQDFAYWSGLSIKDARLGTQFLSNDFSSFFNDGKEYWYLPTNNAYVPNEYGTFLFPDFDEYGISYKNRDIFLNKEYPISPFMEHKHWLMLEGMIEGTWQSDKSDLSEVRIELFNPKKRVNQHAIHKAVTNYQQFHLK